MRVRIAFGCLLLTSFLHAAEIRGKVTNVIGGEPLARVEVSVLDTDYKCATAVDGTFTIKNLKAGNYILRFEAVGYRLVTIPFSIAANEDKEFDVNLAPDNFRRTDKVEVRGDVFQGGDPTSVSEINLTSTEIKEASTVLADDPFRAIQALPGVSAAGNNELYAEFSVIGAPFSQVGVYLDDVLIPPPLHNVPNQQQGASLSLLTSETVEEMKLLSVAYPEKFGDQVGAALDIHTREGSRTPSFRIAPGIADSEFLGEGPLGASQRGAWLASFRKSYIGWLVRNRVNTDFNDVSFYDGDVKLSYDLTPHHTLSVYSLAGQNNVDVANPGSGLQHGATDFYFTRLGWRWSISPNLLIDNHAAYIRQPLSETDVGGHRSDNAYQEWSGGSGVTWSWAKGHLSQAGWTLRHLRDSFQQGTPQSNGTIVYAQLTETELKSDGYLQQSSSFFNNHVHVLAGVRYDAATQFPPHPFSPQLSASVRLLPATDLQLGYGRYRQYQFPFFQGYPAPYCLSASETWVNSDHYTAGIETRAGENVRFRVQLFERRNSGWYHADPAPCGLRFAGATRPGPRDYSQGVQFVAQRRSANKLSGWIGYTLVHARESAFYENQVSHVLSWSPYFSTAEDQRNSLNAFATYRLKPSINLSGKFLYGSGFPISSGLQQVPNGTYVPGPVTRLNAYLRMDCRVDKSWAFARRKLTLYGEVLNVTNHPNRIVTSTVFFPNGVQTTTAVAIPIAPTAGLAFEF